MVGDIIVESTVSVDMLVLVTMEAMDIMVDIMVDMEVVTTGATVAHQALMMTTEQD